MFLKTVKIVTFSIWNSTYRRKKIRSFAWCYSFFQKIDFFGQKMKFSKIFKKPSESAAFDGSNEPLLKDFHFEIQKLWQFQNCFIIESKHQKIENFPFFRFSRNPLFLISYFDCFIVF